MILKEKRGITPVVATVLLILITIVLGIVIFIFFRSITGESVSKNGSPIDNSCEDVDLSVEVFLSSGKIDLINRGAIPVVGVKISKKKLIGEISHIGSLEGGTSIEPGDTVSIGLGELESSLSAGDTILITPILYGEKQSGQGTSYLCGNEHRISTEVQP